MKIYRPRSVHVRIASGCNLGCTFCERANLPYGRKRGTIEFTDGRADLPIEKDMTLETWRHVMDKFSPFVDSMELGGLGEPTLGKIFATAAAEINAAGKSLFFFTNGHYLNAKHVLESVGDRPHISVSMDAGTPEIYSLVRKGNFQEMVSSVRAFREAKPLAVIDSQFTAVADNIDDLPAWVQLCATLEIGRRAAGEQLLAVGADHHSTSRVEQSIRFHRDRTLAALKEAIRIAQENQLWLLEKFPKFSELNPNAGNDGTDPRKLRRWADLMFFGANPCGGESSGGVLQTGTVGPPSGDAGFGAAAAEPVEYITVAKEIYVDYDGTVWSCLARHSLGNIHEGTWESIVDNNLEYQEWLRNWHTGASMFNPTCKSCPRRK
jgi:radical SAM protein with 4Fe4S-binding SPASM domain